MGNDFFRGCTICTSDFRFNLALNLSWAVYFYFEQKYNLVDKSLVNFHYGTAVITCSKVFTAVEFFKPG